jgi:MoaA/NifB/PqqE/SkfB family radical SAM enzyme
LEDKKNVNISTAGIFKDALKLTITNPSQALFFARTFRHQKDAAATRKALEKEGLTVPPVMIFSITKKCNLNCSGCYDRQLRQDDNKELTTKEVRQIFSQAQEIGIAFTVIVGGEPLVRTDLFKLMNEFPKMIFLVFTNGTLLDEGMIKEVKKIKNLIPVLSLEGYGEETDSRRGLGIYSNLVKAMEVLKRNKVFFGTSLTVNRKNYNTITDGEYAAGLIRSGSRFCFYIEYTPVTPGTEDLVITVEQRRELNNLMEKFRERLSALFMAVPGEEDKFGGCLSAGRGFIHINHKGDLEPCPFAPFSDISLKDVSLRKALESELLRKIRENGDNICDEMGGCSLWAKRQWVSSLLK